MDDIQPNYYSCPSVCGFDSQRVDAGFCKGCPVGTEKKEFQDACQEAIKKRLPDHWKDYPTDLLQSTLHSLWAMREIAKSRWTLRTATLLAIYDGEKDRRDRIEDYNRRASQT